MTIRNRVLVFGDLVNDVVVVPRTVIRPDTDTPSVIRPRPGGSAANTASWLGSLGTPVDFVGAVGIADHDLHATELRGHGVMPHLSPAPGLPTSTIVIIVEGEHRTMLTERGANAALAVSQVTEELFSTAAALHLTGYSLFDGPGERGVQQLIARAHEHGIRVSLNPGSAGYIADYGVEAFVRGIAGADILFANLEEGMLLSGEVERGRVARALGEAHRTVVLTLGGKGALVVDAGRTPVLLPAIPVRVLDPTGAGDALAAGFLHRWLATADAVEAARVGIRVASRSLMLLGGRPPI